MSHDTEVLTISANRVTKVLPKQADVANFITSITQLRQLSVENTTASVLLNTS